MLKNRLHILNQWLRNTFGFSHKEMRGFWVIMVSMSALLFLPWLLEKLLYTSQQEAYRKEQILAQVILAKLAQQEKQRADSLQLVKREIYSPFNPNEMDSVSWVNLGASPKLAARITHFVQKGGKFKKKEDLLKIYGFPTDFYKEIESFIQLPSLSQRVFTEKKAMAKRDTFTSSHKERNTLKKEKLNSQIIISSFDLNQADTTHLVKIRGVGLKTAQQIIKYREKLGGFVSLEQLSEIYLLKEKPQTIEEIKKYAFISPNSHQKINLNTASFETLKAHPYIGAKLASTLVNYRKNNGKFTDIAQLKKIKAIDSTKLEQISPYLTIE
ncbi:MAG: helix-hairpin-helix domain-containing protein [Microscillaceae bacterium]|nr:helix-hairpin-helix domain-containing protein [Microscillaceae bacterium]MDW8461680.1 helix-hairpin-helix domain-containing protein [Cytophagales bacterium]